MSRSDSDEVSSSTVARRVSKYHQRRKKYRQKYNKEWEQIERFQNWLRKSRKDDRHFYCTACRTDYIASVTYITRHSVSKRHQRKVSAGQHLQLSGELKGNVSIAAQQGMYFNQQTNNSSTLSQQTTSSQQNAPQSTPNQQQQQPQQNMGNHQQSGQVPQAPMQQSGSHMSTNQLSNSQTASQTPHPQYGMPTNNLHGSGLLGANGGSIGPNGMSVSAGHPNAGMSANTHQGGLTGDIYSMSQSQTINFTQQSLRQRVNVPNGMTGAMNTSGPMGPGGPMVNNGPMNNTGMATGMGSRHISPQTLEQQKLLQQQQMLRAQQAAMQQHMIRPPPPDYKTSAGMMQGMQPRYPSAPPNIRRMPQPMPPSGPMIRSHNMYMVQQQHISTRGMFPRQQNTLGNGDGMPQPGSAEWRHLLMTQQQNANFNSSMRPNYQHQGSGFGLGGGNVQITGLQHQQMRTQQGMVSTGMGPGQQNLGQTMNQGQSMGQGPMNQMASLNQHMISHMQQQQALIQQNSNQMSLSNISIQQAQTLSVTNQALQQQQQQQQQQINHQQQQLMNNPSNNQSNALSFNPQTADFNLDFLENLPGTDSSSFTEQELLNSFDTDPGFNLQDIL